VDGFVRQATGSFFHPVGTCALGDGPAAVVDRDLVVRGATNLRVADASVIPRIPAVATSATAQLIGWRLAELMEA
jgi:choline dehydrogenase